MRLDDVRNARRARFSKFSAKNCRVFGAEKLQHRRRKRGNSVAKNLPKNYREILKAAHDHAKTSAAPICDFVGCATMHARGLRILR